MLIVRDQLAPLSFHQFSCQTVKTVLGRPLTTLPCTIQKENGTKASLIRVSHPFTWNISQKSKTYNSRDSLMVTHLTTNPPVSCLNRAERTGSLVVSTTINLFSLKLTVSRRQRLVNSPMQKLRYRFLVRQDAGSSQLLLVNRTSANGSCHVSSAWLKQRDVGRLVEAQYTTNQLEFEVVQCRLKRLLLTGC